MKGTPVNWTEEALERVRVASGEREVTAIAEEFGLARGTIYSVKKRIADEGVEEILRKQAARWSTYENGGGAVGQSLEYQLGRFYSITVSRAGRGGASTQYNLTIPSRIGEAWLERWGSQVRFEPTESGLIVHPVEKPEFVSPPSWLAGEKETK